MRTRAKPNADKMVSRHVDDEDPLGFWADRADAGRVNKVDSKPEAFKGGALKEITVPRLGMR